jgi:hypothetical protein
MLTRTAVAESYRMRMRIRGLSKVQQAAELLQSSNAQFRGPGPKCRGGEKAAMEEGQLRVVPSGICNATATSLHLRDTKGCDSPNREVSSRTAEQRRGESCPLVRMYAPQEPSECLYHEIMRRVSIVRDDSRHESSATTMQLYSSNTEHSFFFHVSLFVFARRSIS